MESRSVGSGKWVPINQYASRRRISKSTIYRRVRNGELSKRVGDSGPEVFLLGEELARYEDAPIPERGETESHQVDTEFDAEDAYSIADQTLQTMIAMHKEVLAEKSRMLEEWEAELRRREERLEQLVGALSGKEAILTERTNETRELRRALRQRDELIKEQERALIEYRRMQEQREEIDRFTDSSREELTSALNEKDRLLDEKENIIEQLRRSSAQREDTHRESNRLISEMKKALQEAQQLIREKDEIINQIKSEPLDIEGKLRARDQTIAELRSLVNTLESQLEMRGHAHDLTGFSDETGPETGALIQDQLEYLMQTQNAGKYADKSVPPEGEQQTKTATEEKNQ
jgi:chromosome segregation ATPase